MTSVPSIAQAFDPHSQLANSSQYATTFTNPPFDPRRYSTNPAYTGGPGHPGVQQGLLYRKGIGASSGTLGASTGITTNAQNATILDSVKLRFLYNPSDFTEGLSPSDTLFPNIAGQGSTDPNDTAQLVGQTTTTCSFNLLFDRTYEINQSFNTAGDPNQFSHKTGVYVDVITFKALIGIPLNGVGMALFLPVHLILGGVNSPSFYGVITSASIAYTHFSTSMVPLRAAISIQMTQWLDDTGSGSGSVASLGGANTAAIAERNIKSVLMQEQASNAQVIPRTGTAVPGVLGGVGVLTPPVTGGLGGLLTP